MLSWMRRLNYQLLPVPWQDPQLGAWVSTQRRHYKLVEAGEPSPMTEHRIQTLENIGFKVGVGSSME